MSAVVSPPQVSAHGGCMDRADPTPPAPIVTDGAGVFSRERARAVIEQHKHLFGRGGGASNATRRAAAADRYATLRPHLIAMRVEGQSNHEIGESLGVTVYAVEHMFRVFGLSRRPVKHSKPCAPKAPKTPMKCLRCRTVFSSCDTKANRICQPCKETEDWRNAGLV